MDIDGNHDRGGRRASNPAPPLARMVIDQQDRIDDLGRQLKHSDRPAKSLSLALAKVHIAICQAAALLNDASFGERGLAIEEARAALNRALKAVDAQFRGSRSARPNSTDASSRGERAA